LTLRPKEVEGNSIRRFLKRLQDMAVSSAGRKLNVKKATLHLMKVTVHAMSRKIKMLVQ